MPILGVPRIRPKRCVDRSDQAIGVDGDYWADLDAANPSSYPIEYFVLGAVCSFLELFYGHFSPKVDIILSN